MLDTLEAGMSLLGTEVKSMRAGQVAFTDSYISYKDGEAWIVGLHIAPYENAGYSQHEPERDRRLLLHRREIEMWMTKVEQRGLTVVPLKLYFKNSRIKLEIGLCRGKNCTTSVRLSSSVMPLVMLHAKCWIDNHILSMPEITYYCVLSGIFCCMVKDNLPLASLLRWMSSAIEMLVPPMAREPDTVAIRPLLFVETGYRFCQKASLNSPITFTCE